MSLTKYCFSFFFAPPRISSDTIYNGIGVHIRLGVDADGVICASVSDQSDDGLCI